MGGDAEAFTRVVEGCVSTVCSIALAIVRDVPASEDIAQEVFLATWQNLGRLRNPRSFLPWLRQITRNRARSLLRSRSAQPAADELLATVADARPNAHDRLLLAEERELLTRVLDELPDESREVLLLYYREESSTAHVAQLLGMSEAAVRQRLSRARARVREEMLQAFGRAACSSAPGAALVAAVAATLSAPAASAAVASSTAFAGGKSLLAMKASGLGALLGAFGIFMSFEHIGPPLDEEEARGLRALGRDAMLIVIAACVLLPLALRLPHPRVWGLFVYLAYVIGMAALYHIRLPRILGRREESMRPAEDIRRALSAAVAGGVIFFILYKMIAA